MTDERITLPPPNWIDRSIEFVAPGLARRRMEARAAMASYRGAVRTRVDRPWGGTVTNTRNRERNKSWSFRQLRQRARDLENDNVLAGATLDRAVENVIGTGIRVRATSSDQTFNDAANGLWRNWTAGKTADIRHAYTFGAMQRLFYRAKLRDGDCGMLLTEEKGADGIPRPRLQVLEGEFIDGKLGNVDATIIDGIELNGNNAAVAYHIRTEDDKGKENPEPLRIKARDFIFLSRPALYSSFRGESAFNGGFTLFDQVVAGLEATIMAWRAGASQALLITKENAAQATGQLRQQKDSQGDYKPIKTIEPLTINYLNPGEDIKGFNPTQPQQNFPDAIAAFVRFIGLRFGLTIEQLLLDFSRTNYSSARAARLQAEQTAYQEQDDFAATFLARVYPWFISKQIKNGVLTVPAPPDAWSFEWIPQGKPWVDPTKEIRAAAEGVALGVETRSNIAMERGYDFRELCKTNQEDTGLMVAAGLNPDPSGGPPPAAVELVPGTVVAERYADWKCNCGTPNSGHATYCCQCGRESYETGVGVHGSRRFNRE